MVHYYILLPLLINVCTMCHIHLFDTSGRQQSEMGQRRACHACFDSLQLLFGGCYIQEMAVAKCNCKAYRWQKSNV
ncbi:hypothetical protein F5H01DRAFT_347320, partial [Linnemannia elongata]